MSVVARKRTAFQIDDSRYLTDEQLREFTAKGFLVLDSELPDAFHSQIFDRLKEVDESIGHFGNNLLPLMPELQRLLDEPRITGALKSILGEKYSFHAHRALHKNPPGSEEQEWHKDSYWGYTRRVRNHRPWWVMLMYFPQDTSVRKGPTGVLEGSQHLVQLLPKRCKQIGADGKKGYFVLIPYDVWHRKMKNKTQADRYMLKFQFTRLVSPTLQENKIARTPWRRPKTRPSLDMNPIWKANWDWISGNDAIKRKEKNAKLFSASSPRLEKLIRALQAEQEPEALLAAYELGGLARRGGDGGDAALKGLLDALESNSAEHENSRRYSDNGKLWREDLEARSAAHGLVLAGERAIPGLKQKAIKGNPRARKHAVFALGEIGSSKAHGILVRALQDWDVHVRIAAAEAIGLTPVSRRAALGLVEAMKHKESEVRFDAALSLLRFAAQEKNADMKVAVPTLIEGLDDSNRYVSAYCAEALERIGTPDAIKGLMPFLRTARWCSHTDNRRPF